MKIVLQPIGVTTFPTPVYKVEGNFSINEDNSVAFPLNKLLAETLEKDDEVKVIRLMSASGESDKYAIIQKNELDAVNKSIGAKIEYVDVLEDFAEDIKTQEKRFSRIIEQIDPETEIYTDITYGQKTFAVLLLSICTFAEKFLNCEIKKIVYGSVEFDRSVRLPKKETAKIFDVAGLYHLIGLVNVMEAPDSQTAAERIEKFFAM